MNYKIEKTIQKNKKTFIIMFILWLAVTIVFVMPISRAWSMAIMENGKISLETFSSNTGEFFVVPLENISLLGIYWSTFISLLWKVTLGILLILIIGLIKTAPKNEYTDIEHGSSDWCEHGEQYKVLNRKKGIILAENNYLPVDKRGNVNVLVVGRFRIW